MSPDDMMTRVMRRLQMFGWTLREIGDVWGIDRLAVYEAIKGHNNGRDSTTV